MIQTFQKKNIETLKSQLENILANTDQIKKCAKLLSEQKSFPIVGYDYYYAIAKEGALKTKETSFIDANAYALGEFIHGHVALLNEKNAILEIFGEDLGEFEKKNLGKIKDKYKPQTVTIADFEYDAQNPYNIVFEKCKNDIVKYLSIIIILQLLALNVATELGRDIDNPQGLSKVVE